MPDTRKHRGPHPRDNELFAKENWPTLQDAVEHLSWLLTRNYAAPSALKLVGDRFQLTDRQRKAVLRSSCSDQALTRRTATRVQPKEIAGWELHVDGFNLLTTVEAALSGGVLILGRDGCLRDMASMHGNYRKVKETGPAIETIGNTIANFGSGQCIWYLDRPVSNSGRLSEMLKELAEAHDWDWQTDIVNDPDALLRNSAEIVVSADCGVIDSCKSWLNLAREVVEREVSSANVVPLGATVH